MLLGFALTEHCNLRCPHCIRDDVTTVRNLDPDLIFSTVDEARTLFPEVICSFTGGEPTIHPEWERIIQGMHERGIPYRFVSNGWHMARLMPGLTRYPPDHVRISLSGATPEIHDAERGRGSFRRVMLAVAMLTSRQIPTSLSIVVDRRDRHQLREAADLAEMLGCIRISFILPQPVPGSAARDSDLPPEEWAPVRDEVHALSREPGRRTFITMDYGAPSEGPERTCDTFSLTRITVDAKGRLSLCCQLSEYGENEVDVVANLHETSLREAWPLYKQSLAELRVAAAPRGEAYDAYPCLRCARACGKTSWLAAYPESPWAGLAELSTQSEGRYFGKGLLWSDELPILSA